MTTFWGELCLARSMGPDILFQGDGKWPDGHHLWCSVDRWTWKSRNLHWKWGKECYSVYIAMQRSLRSRCDGKRWPLDLRKDELMLESKAKLKHISALSLLFVLIAFNFLAHPTADNKCEHFSANYIKSLTYSWQGMKILIILKNVFI